MSINSKHAYRFVYLRSEKWDNVRLEALVAAQAKCRICGFESVGNDAHHITYPESFWDTSVDDLVILCRPCHELTHAFLTEKRLSKEERQGKWQLMIRVLSKWRASIVFYNDTMPEGEVTPKLLRSAYETMRLDYRVLQDKVEQLTKVPQAPDWNLLNVATCVKVSTDNSVSAKRRRPYGIHCKCCWASGCDLIGNAFAEFDVKWPITLCQECLTEFKAEFELGEKHRIRAVRERYEVVRDLKASDRDNRSIQPQGLRDSGDYSI